MRFFFHISVLHVEISHQCFNVKNRMYVHVYTLVGWLVGCFGLNGPLRQYLSLYRAVSQREGEREEK